MDIVERLRICAKYDPDQAEAADEIERLREALGRIAKHDLQAIAINALSPNARKPIGEKE